MFIFICTPFSNVAIHCCIISGNFFGKGYRRAIGRNASCNVHGRVYDCDTTLLADSLARHFFLLTSFFTKVEHQYGREAGEEIIDFLFYNRLEYYNTFDKYTCLACIILSDVCQSRFYKEISQR